MKITLIELEQKAMKHLTQNTPTGGQPNSKDKKKNKKTKLTGKNTLNKVQESG